ncbi:C-type lectin domain family 4 member G-like protein [Dinothrombium tinctorium]|uniref:C-type lectin domain family 4 member G-like protein n=1 Tax=Dinothrombium tinctorium TaxID=1965070 RepID=A0A443R943_9ACAR|nr:C-type lectin domain family 4 member G-like protein [Dinothrombium tinctorium]
MASMNFDVNYIELSRLLVKNACQISNLSASDCPKSWLQYENRCYLISHNGRTLQSAFEYCKLLGAHLAIFRSLGEQEFLASKFKEGTLYWIGSLQVTRGRMFYIWLDLTPINYHWNWLPGKPNYYENACSGVSVGKEYFSDDTCPTGRGFICQKLNRNETLLFDEYPGTLTDYIGHKMVKNDNFKSEIFQFFKSYQNQARSGKSC